MRFSSLCKDEMLHFNTDFAQPENDYHQMGFQHNEAFPDPGYTQSGRMGYITPFSQGDSPDAMRQPQVLMPKDSIGQGTINPARLSQSHIDTTLLDCLSQEQQQSAAEQTRRQSKADPKRLEQNRRAQHALRQRKEHEIREGRLKIQQLEEKVRQLESHQIDPQVHDSLKEQADKKITALQSELTVTAKELEDRNFDYDSLKARLQRDESTSKAKVADLRAGHQAAMQGKEREINKLRIRVQALEQQPQDLQADIDEDGRAKEELTAMTALKEALNRALVVNNQTITEQSGTIEMLRSELRDKADKTRSLETKNAALITNHTENGNMLAKNIAAIEQLLADLKASHENNEAMTRFINA